MANKPYALEFQADFNTMIRDATKAGKDLTGIFAKAIKLGFDSKGIKKMTKEMEDLRKNDRHLQEEIEMRMARIRAKNEGRLEAERTDAARKLSELNRKLNDRNNDQQTKDRLQAEKKVAKLRYDVFKEEEEFNDNMDKAAKNLLATVRGMERSAQKTSAMTKNYERSQNRLTTLTKYFNGSMLDGADQFIEKLSDGLDGLAGKLTSTVDAGALFKGLAGGASKGISAVGDALGTMVPILGTIATGLAGVVAIAGVVGAVFFEADKKVKEFNKSAVNTFGALDLARIGGGDLNRSMLMLNRTVHNLTANLGITSEEAMGLLDSLDKGGLTLSELTRRSLEAGNQQTELAKTIVNVGTTARMMGVSISEYSSTLLDYVNDLGSSLDTVNDSFSNIAAMAAESSFGTRRFYSMVVQATSGQASLNTRLEDTAGLLMRMTKILGQKKAMEMAQNHGSDLANMGTQDRYRMVMQVGGHRTGQAIRQDASHQAANFGRAAGEGGPAQAAALAHALEVGMGDAAPELSRAITEASRGNTDDLVNRLAQMDPSQRGAITAGMTGSGNTVVQGLGRQLSQLMDVARGTRGGLDNQTSSFDGASAGMSMRMRMEQLRALSPNGNLQGIDRMRGENLTGLSGQAVSALIEMDRTTRGQYVIAKKALKETFAENSTRDLELARTTGATIRKGRMVAAQIRRGEDGRETVSTGEDINTAEDLVNANVERSGEELSNVRSAQEMLMQQTADATISVGDILENKIYQVLMDIAGWGTPFMQALSKYLGADTSGVETIQAITQAIQQQSGSIGSAQREIAATATAAGSATGPARAALLEKKAQQEKKLLALQSDRQALSEARDRIRGGNDYDRRSVQYQASQFTNGQNIALGTYNTEAEARLAHPMAETNRVETLDSSPAETIKRTLERAASWRNGTAPGAAAPAAATAAPTAAPSVVVAPVVQAVTEASSNASTMAVTSVAAIDAVTTAVDTAAGTAAENAATSNTLATDAATANATIATDHRADADRRQRAGQQHLTQMLTRETKLGDALARSKLPGAIVDAQVRQQIMAAGTAAGMTPENAAAVADQLLSGGELNTEQRNRLGATPDSLSMLLNAGYDPARGGRIRGQAVAEGAQSDPPVDDFIYRGNGANGSITPIDTSDQFVGLRPGGAIDQAVNGRNGPTGRSGGGGNFTVHIHGGDERRVFDVVKRVLQQSGIAPSRGTPSA